MTPYTKPVRKAPGVILLSTAQAAGQLMVSPHTLIDWRRPGFNGPSLPWVCLGRRIFYRSDDVAAFQSRLLRDRRYPVRSAALRSASPAQVAQAA